MVLLNLPSLFLYQEEKTTLHSSMVLLNLISKKIVSKKNFSLHSSMVLLNRFYVNRVIRCKLVFTFQYGSIKSFKIAADMDAYRALHSSMVLLNRINPVTFCSR